METALFDDRRVKAYGDEPGDGAVQLSFTLPLPRSPRATAAARAYVERMGLREPYVAFDEAVAPGFTFFVVYGRATHEVDATALAAAELEIPELGREEIDEAIARRYGRRLVVLGCALETDAHTVGLDAIFSMKGFAGDYGLERYASLDARNLGAQVSVARAARLVKESDADALLVSATVTSSGVHVRHLKELVAALEAERLRDRVVLAVGGPRVGHALAKELGYDAGFGLGTTPSRVAAFLLEEVKKRKGSVR